MRRLFIPGGSPRHGSLLPILRLAGRLLLLWLGVSADVAQPQAGEEGLSRIGLPGEALRLGRRLADVQKLVDRQQWAEAIEEYQQVLDEAGDELVPISPRHCLQGRWLCHVRLAALPPAGSAATAPCR